MTNPNREVIEGEIKKLVDVPVELAMVPLDRLLVIRNGLRAGDHHSRYAADFAPHDGPKDGHRHR
ncbi:hypothetical protein EYW49_11225 [Siculibacillus lacustris]|uniref:Uncharacterized protein n=1 Tax=Siculibacillus lacustris TaxID=1549641 RepID=A0A4Q9VPV9_9HYPH|nr:hypothetical protein [Siculibacillus lacustris]TBW37669.1 hypothetical protein EYW49_11225 [Siculibacillus lacustris]